jgi:hypothetical protein
LPLGVRGHRDDSSFGVYISGAKVRQDGIQGKALAFCRSERLWKIHANEIQR